MESLNRITFNSKVMGGKPCIRGMRITVGTLVGLVAAGRSFNEILEAYPILESEDIEQALGYAAWRSEEIELPLNEVLGEVG
jgi:uncharacterized protein (DUF433 family)